MPRQGKLLFGHQRAVAQPSVEIGGLVPSSLSAARVPELRFHQTTCGQGAGPRIVGLVLIGAGARRRSASQTIDLPSGGGGNLGRPCTVMSGRQV